MTRHVFAVMNRSLIIDLAKPTSVDFLSESVQPSPGHAETQNGIRLKLDNHASMTICIVKQSNNDIVNNFDS